MGGESTMRLESTVGELLLTFAATKEAVEGQTAAKRDSTGTAVVTSVVADGVSVDLAYIEWDNGDREVRGLRVDREDPILQRITRAFRAGVEPARPGVLVMRMRIPRLKQEGWTTPHATTVDEITDVTGLDPRRVLPEVGALAVGPRSQILGDQGRTRNELAVLAPMSDAAAVLTTAHTLAVVIPSIVLSRS